MNEATHGDTWKTPVLGSDEVEWIDIPAVAWQGRVMNT